jgi:pyrroline-5-carboxylate reductase
MEKPGSERSTDVVGRKGPLSDTMIAFIGAGAMGEAMIGGLVNSHLVPPGAIVASDPREGRAEELRARFGIRAAAENRAAVREAQIVVLSVKPQVLRTIFRDLRGAIPPQALVLSIVAGARLESITQGLRHPAVVRTMPNTPAQVGEGMTVWTATPEVTPLQCRQAQAIVQALGKELRVAEEVFLDMATAISGTGPAYVFLLMEALIDAAVHLGFSRDDARTLVLQTVRGTVIFAEQSSCHPAEMRNLVTSPGGTSAHALYQLEKGGFRTVLSKAVWAAYQRSVSLAALTSAVRPFEDEDTTDADAEE